MAIKRQKLDRKVNLTLDGDRVVDMPPGWKFTVDCPHHGKVTLDFTPFAGRGRDDLLGHLRDAYWNLRKEFVGATLRNNFNGGFRYFWRFVEDTDPAAETLTHLSQVDRNVFDQFVAWLELQPALRGPREGSPLSLSARKVAVNRVKALLRNRQARNPSAVSSELSFPRNPFPNADRLIPSREPYSITEHKRILTALHDDLQVIHGNQEHALSYDQVIAVHVLVLGFATGRNLQSLLDLRRDSLQKHPIEDRELLVTYKRRGWSSQATAIVAAENESGKRMLTAIPASIGEHFRSLCEITAPLIEESKAEDRDFVLLVRMKIRSKLNSGVVRFDGARVARALREFSVRHTLLDDAGRPIMLHMSRARPTFATELYRRCRDIRKVKQALGHTKVTTTARHYVDAPPEAERDHALVADALVGVFTSQEIEGKVLVAADGKIPLQDVKDLLSGGYNTGIARCKNPFRENESVCKKFFACFKCPSMCVFEDDLWRLFSFYYRLIAERSKINAAHWLKTYGPIIRRIDADIAPLFPADKVEEARTRARSTPHPTWKGPLL
ncbi:MAG: hypothetical protein FAZ92_01361 [Accumulibacter sp.]|nr:MAG: hypothetical protein FAZ92_01361 [Accumulibacter sp.]